MDRCCEFCECRRGERKILASFSALGVIVRVEVALDFTRWVGL